MPVFFALSRFQAGEATPSLETSSGRRSEAPSRAAQGETHDHGTVRGLSERRASEEIATAIAAATAVGAMVIGGPSASASCQTNPDVGDVCNAMDVVCRAKAGAYLEYCR